jgi:hypothetical protein
MTDFPLAVDREPWLAIRRDVAILCSVRAVGFVVVVVCGIGCSVEADDVMSEMSVR